MIPTTSVYVPRLLSVEKNVIKFDTFMVPVRLGIMKYTPKPQFDSGGNPIPNAKGKRFHLFWEIDPTLSQWTFPETYADVVAPGIENKESIAVLQTRKIKYFSIGAMYSGAAAEWVFSSDKIKYVYDKSRNTGLFRLC